MAHGSEMKKNEASSSVIGYRLPASSFASGLGRVPRAGILALAQDF